MWPGRGKHSYLNPSGGESSLYLKTESGIRETNDPSQLMGIMIIRPGMRLKMP